MGLFPPLLPSDLVFTPGDPQEFRRLVEEELGPVDADLVVVEQEEQQMIHEFELTVGELGLLDPDVGEVAVIREEIGGAPAPVEREEVAAALDAGQPDIAQLLAIAGLLPDQQVPPAPNNPNPQPAPPGGGGPGNGGGGAPPPGQGGDICFFSDIAPSDPGAYSPSPGVWCIPTGGPPPVLP